MNNILSRGRILTILCLSLVFIINSSFRNSSESISAIDNCVVVIIENLNPQIYKSILLESREDSDLELTRSCIPAKLLLFTCVNQDLSTEDLKLKVSSVIQNSSNAEGLEISSYTPEQFDEICALSRTGQ